MKYKILLVDDEEMILSMLEKCLKDKFLCTQRIVLKKPWSY